MLPGILFLTACSTKVELNTEWQDTTIIYGLLDQNEEYHYIKINKAFLGDGNYFAYAQIRDSSEYAHVGAYIEERNNGVLVATHQLRDTLLSNRDVNGAFYAPEHTVYYFRHTSLNPTHEYRLVANINEGTSSEKQVSGETDLITPFSPPTVTSIVAGTYDVATGHHFLNQTMKFLPPANASQFDVIWRLKWDEYTASDTMRKTYDWKVGSKGREGINAANGQFELDVSGEAFFKTIANVVSSDPAVVKRIFRSVDIIVYAGSDDLATYININKPQSGLVQERPEFTNITNGMGLFASRLHVMSANRPLSLGTYRELVYGPHTGSLLFCSDTTSPAYAISPSVVCP